MKKRAKTENASSSTADAPPTGMVSAAVAMVPIASPTALFAAEHQLVSPVPTPLDLLLFVPASTKASYEKSDRSIVNAEDSRVIRTIQYSSGLRVEVDVQGSQELGLPTQEDVDFLLAILRLHDQGRVTRDGTVIDPTYRDILRAAGRRHASSRDIAACKRALRRWGRTTIETRAQVDHTELARDVRRSVKAPRAPDGGPVMREGEKNYWILEYQTARDVIESEDSETTREVNKINHLRINPVWLDQMAAGWLTWIDVDLHNALPSDWAKRIYVVFATRAALGWRPYTPYMATLDQFIADLGYTFEGRKRRDKVLERVRAAIDCLVERGVLSDGSVRKGQGWTYHIEVHPGDVLLVGGLLRGVGANDPPVTRMLVAHLRAYGIAINTARQFVQEKPFQVRAVLCRAHYLQTIRRVQDTKDAIQDWAGWVYRMIEQNVAFDDGPYVRWLDELSRSVARGSTEHEVVDVRSIRQGPRRRLRASDQADGSSGVHSIGSAAADATSGTGGKSSTELPPLQFPDDDWGTVLREMADTIPDQAMRAWLITTRLTSLGETTAVITCADHFNAEWVRDKYGALLEERLSASQGRPLHLEFVGESPSGRPR